jgi:hypothetical protein
MTRTFLLTASSILCWTLLAQQQAPPTGRGAGMLLGGSYGLFFNSAKDWRTYYNESNKRLNASFALGFNEIFLTGTYGKLEAQGASKLKNLPVGGVAVWKQEFYEAGVRQIKLEPTGGWYFDFAYFRSNASESISTIKPEVPELAANSSARDEGLSLGFGLLLNIVGPSYLDIALHYAITGLSSDKQAETVSPNLGGWNLSVGITLIEQ